MNGDKPQPFDPYYYDPANVRRRLAELAGTPLLPELPSPRQYDVGIGPGQMTPTEIGVRGFMDQLTGRSYNLARPLTSPTNLAILGGTAVAPELAPFASRAFGLGMGTVGAHELEQGKYPEAATSLGLGVMGLAAPSLRPGQRVDLKTTPMLSYDQLSGAMPYAERPGIVREPEPTGAPGGGGVPAGGVPYVARPRSGVSLLGLSIRRDLAKRDWVDLRGKQINTPEDIASAAQVFRSPQYETFHVMYVKDGQIVAHEALTSRLPAGVATAPKEQSARFAYGIKNRADRLKADDVWLLHNHPSGRTEPSQDDVYITTSLARRVPNLKGQIIINDVDYGEISPTGNISYGNIPQEARVAAGLGETEIPHPELGHAIQNTSDVASVGSVLKAPENVVSLIYRGSNGTVRALESVPVSLYTKPAEMANWIRGRQREYGASMTLSYYDSTGRFVNDVTQAGMELMRTRAIRDGILSTEGGTPTSLDAHFTVTREPEQWPKTIRVREPEKSIGEEGSAEFKAPPKVVPPFYSQLERVIDAKMPNVTTVDQLQGILKDPRIKGTELEATGLQRWLDTMKGSTVKVTKDEVRRQLALDKVELKDVTFGQASQETPETRSKIADLDRQIDAAFEERNHARSQDLPDIDERLNQLHRERIDLVLPIDQPIDQPKFDRPSLQLPGGSNYREKLLVMPGGRERTEWTVTGQDGRVIGRYPTETEAHVAMRGTQWDPVNQVWKDPLGIEIKQTVGQTPLYTEPHFNVDNVVAHGRFTDRTTTAGEPMLFGEELQSQAALDVRKAEAKGEPSPWKGFPFEKNWHELMLWRALRMAAEEGKTRFGWTTGQQQIDRYSLEKQVSKITTTNQHWGKPEPGEWRKPTEKYRVEAFDLQGRKIVDKLMPEDELAGTIGADLAKKAIESGTRVREWTGLDLKVGGEGKRQLYDQMLTQAANRIGKRYGARVEDVEMKAARLAAELGAKSTATVHSLPITPELYQALMGEGRPLFQSPLPFLAGGAGAALAGAAAASKGKAETKEGGNGIRRVRLPDGTVYEFHGNFTDAQAEEAINQHRLPSPPPLQKGETKK